MPCLSPDGLVLYFSSDQPSPVHSSAPAGPGRVATINNIWVARRKSVSEPFGPPESLGVHFQHLHTMLDPHLSADGSTLFFATTGLLNTAGPFADLWQVPILKIAPPALSIILDR